jgi:hypothetical protein
MHSVEQLRRRDRSHADFLVGAELPFQSCGHLQHGAIHRKAVELALEFDEDCRI